MPKMLQYRHKTQGHQVLRVQACLRKQTPLKGIEGFTPPRCRGLNSEAKILGRLLSGLLKLLSKNSIPFNQIEGGQTFEVVPDFHMINVNSSVNFPNLYLLKSLKLANHYHKSSKIIDKLFRIMYLYFDTPLYHLHFS